MRYPPLFFVHFLLIGAEFKSNHFGMPRRGHPTLRVVFWYPDIFILSFVDHVVSRYAWKGWESQKIWSYEFEASLQYTWASVQNTPFERGFWFQLLLSHMLEKGILGYDQFPWGLYFTISILNPFGLHIAAVIFRSRYKNSFASPSLSLGTRAMKLLQLRRWWCNGIWDMVAFRCYLL